MKPIFECISGSKLYGLSTENSDTDINRLAIHEDPLYICGVFDSRAKHSIGELDVHTYEFSHFVSLLMKGATSALEMLAAPDNKCTFLDKEAALKNIRANWSKFIDSTKLFNSLNGYLLSEGRLALGERTGRLGSSRSNDLKKYGYSPKNFVHMLRLCQFGIEIFQNNKLVAELSGEFRDKLFEIKTNPPSYDADRVSREIKIYSNKLENAYLSRVINHSYDLDFVREVLKDVYNFS